MQTDIIKIDQNGAGREEALDATTRFAAYYNLNSKQERLLRLLSEETLSMVSAITEDFYADFWLESNKDNVCRIHLKAKTTMDYKKRKELISVSTSGKNAAYSGIMGKIRGIIENSLYDYDEVSALQAEYGYGPVMYGTTGLNNLESPTLDPGMYIWSLQQYKGSVEMLREQDSALEEAWDELEKSIVANLADEVKVAVRGDSVEMVIEKKL